MRWLLICLLLASCATAGKGNSIIGGLTDAGPGDGGDIPGPDASSIDAPANQVTLTQTTSDTITIGNSFVCFSGATGFTRQNSYYRVFAPGDHGVTTTLHVFQVVFGIELATAGSGGKQPAQVKLGTYAVTPQGTTLDPTQVRPLSSVDIQVRDGTGTQMVVPITGDVPPNTNLIVELMVPDGLADGNVFVIGSNALGERKPGYTSEPDCGLADPTTMQSVAPGSPPGEVDIILTATGTD